ncbi:FAD-dependent oxidoreductase domain-containing protein 1-like [Chelonus insularis]|uniref:FAD-dependent oxidoreductase domain-containing protein 1-like n=1 Tax=Chelonus insularis TaxID=460826 RepID=UPI00158AD33F|nr:FAD-dependent oxidoreductase domain-containing protein 1-like [Chelonus insularis]XP_034947865.1 FAD-dependent oxidoreductase domain-containing protein 1-like [Chelonus insularis]
MLRRIIQNKKTLDTICSRSIKSSAVLQEEHKVNQKYTYTYDNKKEPDGYWTSPVEPEDAYDRAFRVLGKQFRTIRNNVFFWKRPYRSPWKELEADSVSFPSHIDVLIIGGGIMGCSAAYWLKKVGGDNWSVVVVDRKPMNLSRPMLISSNNLRQQFGLIENIEMSQFAADFFKNINYHLRVRGQPRIDIGYRPHGNLFLTRNEEEAEALEKSVQIMNNAGTKVALLSQDVLKKRFPWLNTDGIVLGTLGLELEGSFDPWALLNAYKTKALDLGVEFVTAELKGFIISSTDNEFISSPSTSTINLNLNLNHASVQTVSGERKVIQFAMCVIAAGHESSDVAKLMKIGNTTGIRSVPLPIQKRKRFLYGFEASNGPGLNTPMVMDTSGCYFKRETLSNHYTAGRVLQDEDEESYDENPEPNDDFFYNKIHPTLAHRVPAFKDIKLKQSWASFYDYNTFDGNGIVGVHPYYNHIFFATGFGEHAPQMSPAVGRSLCEVMKNGAFTSINLNRLCFDRFITQEYMTAAVL